MQVTKSFRRGILAIYASVAALGGASVCPAAENSTDDSAALSEIVVTAQKKTERLQDVPIPVTAISGDSLVNSNQLRLQDYFTQVPGLAVVPNNGGQVLAIRGITTGQGNPSVGVTIDDVQYGSSTTLGGNYVPDIDPSELARIEVLRGPQGTIYGASSLGGLVKYVTIDPSTDAVSGRMEAGTSTVYNGAALGYNFRGSVNVPLGETLALRASAFTREDPGYIDNPVRGVDGINEEWVSGGRVAALWRPSDVLSLKLSALFQYDRSNGNNDVDLSSVKGYPLGSPGYPPLTGLQQNYIPGTGNFYHKLQAYSMTLNAKLGSADLTSVTAFNVSHASNSVDFTSLFGPLWSILGSATGAFIPPGPTTGTPGPTESSTDKFTQELRLSIPLSQQIDWLVGGYFTHERGPLVTGIYAANPTTGAVLSQTAVFSEFNIYAEYSAFTNMTFHLTDRFDVQFGGRETFINEKYSETDTGPFTPIFVNGENSPAIQPNVYTNQSAFTYLVTPQFRVSPDLMVYARLASGYRPGGANATAAPFDVPLTFKPDRTKNYEVGVKGDTLGHTLSFDASVFYIDWKDIQLSFVDPTSGDGFTANGSRAKSQGVELSAESKPLTGLTISAWVTFTEAELTATLPPVSNNYGAAGDMLPYSNRFSANMSVQQDFPLVNTVTGFVGAAVRYVGQSEGIFQGKPGNPAPRQDYPAYARTDLRAGAKYELWEANFFVNNLTDKRGIINGGLGYVPAYGFVYVQPRTIGLSVARRF